MHDELMSSMDISQKMLELTACAILPIESGDTKYMNGNGVHSNHSESSNDSRDSMNANTNSAQKDDMFAKTGDESALMKSIVSEVSNEVQNHICDHFSANSDSNDSKPMDSSDTKAVEAIETSNSADEDMPDIDNNEWNDSIVANGGHTNDSSAETNSCAINGLSNGLEVIDGCVEPPFDPPNDKCLRFTNQLQFLRLIMTKYLVRYKTALPFLKPVDCIKLKIPEYYKTITNPMDLQTIKRRLMFLWYSSANDCLNDFKLMFENCFKFNSCDNFVYTCGKKLEEYLEEKLKDMPKDEIEIPCPPKPSIEEMERKAAKRRPETTTLELQDSIIAETLGDSMSRDKNCTKKMITRSEHGFQPKRPNKELPTPIASPPQPAPKRVQLNTSMKFCLDIIKELLTKKHRDYAWPFYEPVSSQQYPDYLEVVKKPIDLTTIKTKIETGQYKSVKPFVKDMRLMITNCLRYNKPEAPVIEQARKLRDFFEYRYARIPEELLNEKMSTIHNNSHQNTNGFEQQSNSKHKEKELDPEMDSESHQRMKLLETQVKLLTSTITALTGTPIDIKALKPKNGLKKTNNTNNRKRSKAPAKQRSNRTVSQNNKRQKNKALDDSFGDQLDDSDEEELAPSPIPFQFDDMEDLKQLKTDLENLDAKDLKNVLRILQLTEPSIKCDNDENIEIDFEVLKPETLIALRKFVSSCMLNNVPKRNKSSVNGSESSKKRSNCDMKNGYNVSDFAADSVSHPSTSRLSDSSSDSESESSSDSESDDD